MKCIKTKKNIQQQIVEKLSNVSALDLGHFISIITKVNLGVWWSWGVIYKYKFELVKKNCQTKGFLQIPQLSLSLCSAFLGWHGARGDGWKKWQSWVLKKIDFFLICYIKGLAGQRRGERESESGTWSANQFPCGVLNSQRPPFIPPN